MNSRNILKYILLTSAGLVLLIYFQYRTYSWPVGLEALECLVSLIVLAGSVYFLIRFNSIFSTPGAQANLSIGFFIGLLWTIEISINNIIRPGLPLRDIIDDIFWAIIAALILFFAIRDSNRNRKIASGIISGFMTGFSSGAVACISGLVLIRFGMSLVLKDELNIREWQDVKDNIPHPDMAVYFAYQSLAGALMHLVILGVIMGLLLGLIGGCIGVLFRRRSFSP